MEIIKIKNPKTDQNTYLLKEVKSGVLIDPGAEEKDILSAISGLSIEYILVTHCHFDHIEFLEEIKKKTGAKVVGSKNLSKNILDDFINVSAMFGSEKVFEKPDITLDDGEKIKTSVGEIKCIYTPGHTDCSICYLIDDNLFSGDTLFSGSVGRWDLATANVNSLVKSIKKVLYKLDDNLKVYPGHGSDTTIGYEKKFNPCIKADK